MWRVLSGLVYLAWFYNPSYAGPGVWHGVDDETGDTIFYLYLDGTSSRLYSPLWADVPNLTIEGDGFRFRLPYKSYGIKCEGLLSGSLIKGTWQIHQVQYLMKGTWTARQLFAAEKWAPDGFLESGSDVDIGFLLTGDFVDYDAFLDHWNQRVEPEFFALLTETLYADDGGDYRPNLKSERVKQVYETLSSVERFPLCARGVLPGVSQARKLLLEKYPWLASNITVVSTFSLGKFDYRMQKFADRYLLLLGVDWLAQSLTEEGVVGLAAEGLVSSFHFRTLPLGSQGRNEIFRRSIATYTIERLEEPEVLYFGSELSAPSASSRQLLQRHSRDKFRDFYSACLAGDNRTETYSVLREFGHFLAKNGEPASLFRLTLGDLQRALKRYFDTFPEEGDGRKTPQVRESS